MQAGGGEAWLDWQGERRTGRHRQRNVGLGVSEGSVRLGWEGVVVKEEPVAQVWFSTFLAPIPDQVPFSVSMSQVQAVDGENTS